MNKNQKQIRRILARDGEVNQSVPAGGYHNHEKGAWVTRSFAQVKYVHKRKVSPFPKNVNDDKNVTMTRQREIFNGVQPNN